jgi:pyruvate/2-oxoacid:ferredoxin oxidoreductase alpha subunit
MLLEGSQACAEAVRLARVKVVSAYPITPQTHIVEELAKFCSEGSLDGRFLCVESEHSAMAAVIGAAAGGVRTFTASSSQGLALMHEMLHWAAGGRLPIVMAEVNRALGPGWNLWADQTDSLAQRDTGWIQLYCADGQEVLDTTLQAYRLAEAVNLPVMVILDAFFLSHTWEPVDLPDQEKVDRFLPPYSPRFCMNTADPQSLHGVAPIGVYMEMRRSMQLAMEAVPEHLARIEEEFATLFGRSYGPVESYLCDDADVILVTSGTAAGTARVAVDQLRNEGEKAGLLRIRMFRPFPVRSVRQVLKSVQKVAVLDRNCSFGAGGIFASELKSALHGGNPAPVYSYIAGLGGRDITVDTIRQCFSLTRAAARPDIESVWLGVKEELLK